MTDNLTTGCSRSTNVLGRYAMATCCVLAALTFVEAVPAQLPPRPNRNTVDEGEPALFVAKRFIELGTILEGQTPTLTWTLENRGRGELAIARTRTSCGCTVVSLSADQKRIAPGATLDLSATFDSRGRIGDATKTITVYSNDPTEPELKLEFHVNVEPLYNINPPGIINLRMVRRGDVIRKTIEIIPAEGHTQVEIKHIDVPSGSPISYRFEPFDADHGTGQRIHLTVARDVPLGTLRADVTVQFTVDGHPCTQKIAMRGQIVGDLVWRPSVLDMTRHPVSAGRTLSPVVIESTTTAPFEVVEASAGPLFDVRIDRKKTTSRSIELVLRADATPGPFAASLVVHTDSLDQPLVSIPVFGVVAAPVEIDPPLILLRADGTQVGAHRRVKIRAQQSSTVLKPKTVSCDDASVRVAVDERESNRQPHIFYLDVTLVGTPPPGRHQATLTIETDAPGIGTIHIPVEVDGPK